MHTHLPDAERSRIAIFSTNTTGGLAHFDSSGWLTPVVNPYDYTVQGAQSPEGQAFVLMMQAAWRDWVDDGAKGVGAALSLSWGVMGWRSVTVWCACVLLWSVG